VATPGRDDVVVTAAVAAVTSVIRE
jgi:hypothetical protein